MIYLSNYYNITLRYQIKMNSNNQDMNTDGEDNREQVTDTRSGGLLSVIQTQSTQPIQSSFSFMNAPQSLQFGFTSQAPQVSQTSQTIKPLAFAFGSSTPQVSQSSQTTAFGLPVIKPTIGGCCGGPQQPFGTVPTTTQSLFGESLKQNTSNLGNPFGSLSQTQYFSYNPQTGYTPISHELNTKINNLNKKKVIETLYSELKKIRSQIDALNKTTDSIYEIISQLQSE